MSEKRFECVFVEEGFGGTYRRLRDNETGIVHMTCDVADLLNFQNTQIKCLKEENEQLKQKIKRWKNLYELKDAEVTARVDTLNRVCNYYLNEIGFKSDTDPNEAVKEVINEILNAPIYEE